MSWDFAEAVPTVSRPATSKVRYECVEQVHRDVAGSHGSGQTQLADAAEHPLPDQTAEVWFTDPPYYDAVPYADLSDFFFVWLKRALPDHPLCEILRSSNPLTPRTREVVQDDARSTTAAPKDRASSRARWNGIR